MARRFALHLEGRLQGVGFRPMVFRLAEELSLTGWVRNTCAGVELEIQGDAVDRFEGRLRAELPAHASIRSLRKEERAHWVEREFRILPSIGDGAPGAEILPDLATCPACVREIQDPSDRRHRYPFTNCTDCGPRFSILERVPYDRGNTSMRAFAMCPECEDEFQDTRNRRFHAQGNCCPKCGPWLSMKDQEGRLLCERDEALDSAAKAIRLGEVVAIQGIGGFHLICDARNASAVSRLREAKLRPAKPFAVMVPDVESARELCEVSSFEASLLESPRAPIVLLKGTPPTGVAPGASTLGVMLPFSPLHCLLMRELGFSVVATSGNVSDEPTCRDEGEALGRLRGIADRFVVHNRRIAACVDDSVVRVIAGTEVVFRAGRGYAPLVIPAEIRSPMIGVGAHLKSTVAYSREERVVLGPHLGDLETVGAIEAHRAAVQRVWAPGTRTVSDLHPDYVSTRVARERDDGAIRIQHHHAHVLSCMAEHGLDGPVLGVAWDGTGFGTDGTIWGGEFLRVTREGFERAGSLRPFRIPGNAMKEPRRAALGAMFEIGRDREAWPHGFCESEFRVLSAMCERGLNSTATTSAGRLFDAVASLLGLCQIASFEGQAAMALESAASEVAESYDVRIAEGERWLVDWEPILAGILGDLRSDVPRGRIAARFHGALARSIVEVAQRVGERRVVLSGGCFQNRVFSERAISLLKQEGFLPYWNQKVPPNDGGISVGQVIGGSHVLVDSR